MIKKAISVLLVNTLLLGQAQSLQNNIETVAVFDFTANSVSASVAQTLSDRLRIELTAYPDLYALERNRIDAVLEEQAIQLSGCVDECLVEVGQLLGASSIITGSIGKVGSFHTINARKINATTGKVENAFGYDSKYNIDELLVSGMKEVAYQIAKGDNRSTTIQSIPKPPSVAPEPFDPVTGIVYGIGCVAGFIIIATMVLVIDVFAEILNN